MPGRIPFRGEVAVQPPSLHSDTTTLTPLPPRRQTPELSPQKGPGTSHRPSSVPREPPSPVSFSSRCKDCSEGAQFSRTSQKQKCLYVGVCLRNNRLLCIKAPFILFAGMCFLGSRGWDAQWSPVRDATANFQGCAGAGAGGGVCTGPGTLCTSGRSSAFNRPACILSAEQFVLPNTFLCGFPYTGGFIFHKIPLLKCNN